MLAPGLLIGIFTMTLITLLLIVQPAFPHGADGVSEKKVMVKPPVSPRFVPKAPSIIAAADLKNIGDGHKSLPADVVMITCRISGVAACRGVRINLLNLNAEKIVTAHTGLGGAVGFQGLEETMQYQAEIEDPRYLGSKLVYSGNAVELIAERK